MIVKVLYCHKRKNTKNIEFVKKWEIIMKQKMKNIVLLCLLLGIGTSKTMPAIESVLAEDSSGSMMSRKKVWDTLEPGQQAGDVLNKNPVPNEENTVKMGEKVKIVDNTLARMQYKVTDAAIYHRIEDTGYSADQFQIFDKNQVNYEMDKGEKELVMVTMEAEMLEAPKILSNPESEIEKHLNIMSMSVFYGDIYTSQAVFFDADDDEYWERKEKEYFYFYCEDDKPTTLKVGFLISKEEKEEKEDMYLAIDGAVSTVQLIQLDQLEE